MTIAPVSGFANLSDAADRTNQIQRLIEAMHGAFKENDPELLMQSSEVCRRADVSESVLHRHFDTFEALKVRACQEWLGMIDEWLSEYRAVWSYDKDLLTVLLIELSSSVNRAYVRYTLEGVHGRAGTSALLQTFVGMIYKHLLSTRDLNQLEKHGIADLCALSILCIAARGCIGGLDAAWYAGQLHLMIAAR